MRVVSFVTNRVPQCPQLSVDADAAIVEGRVPGAGDRIEVKGSWLNAFIQVRRTETVLIDVRNGLTMSNNATPTERAKHGLLCAAAVDIELKADDGVTWRYSQAMPSKSKALEHGKAKLQQRILELRDERIAYNERIELYWNLSRAAGVPVPWDDAPRDDDVGDPRPLGGARV